MAEKARVPRPKGGTMGSDYSSSTKNPKGENAKFSVAGSAKTDTNDNHGPSFPKGKSGERAAFTRKGSAFPRKSEPSVKRSGAGTAGRQSG